MIPIASVCAALAGVVAAPAELRWVDGGRPTPQAIALVEVLKASALEALDPEDYGAGLWDGRMADLSSRGQRAFDKALTAAAERYVADRHTGRVNPGHAGASLDKPAAGDVRAFVRRLATAADVREMLRETDKPFPPYQRLLGAYRQYLALARRDPGGGLPRLRGIVDPGGRWSGVPRVAELLALTGDLRGARAGAGDGYDPALAGAVRRFQQRHGLLPDGRLGSRTVRALNVPFARRARQLELAIERLRWLPQTLAAPLVVVNIPEYRLRAYGMGEALEMNVVVGRAFRYRTPVFASTLRGVVFRPFWNVPRSIERDELIAQLEREPGKMEALGFEAVDARGIPVRDGDLPGRLRGEELRLRQRPGARNALGLVKFELPNRFGVYLHGTPSMSLFARQRRDLSHGCIRVEDAETLAMRVLGWPRDRVAQAMAGDQTLRVTPERPLPVLILYSTAIAREDGSVHFFDDVYKLDAALERALERGRAQRLPPSALLLPQGSHPSGAALLLQ
ncbi:MAG TPA: L,D-transpeptidase family protein [Myxococcales bacterium]|nr:L,D-transpeptidase family protein [Myxococcales bacterium]